MRRLAGARLATIRRSGKSKPQLASAARTRSRASRTAASGRPTTEKAGRPAVDVDLDPHRPGGDAVESECPRRGEHRGHARRVEPRVVARDFKIFWATLVTEAASRARRLP